MLSCGSNEAKSLHATLPVNSLLGTFAPGQTNAGGVRHVPYLDWGAARYDCNRRITDLIEITIFRLRMWILLFSPHFTPHTSHFLMPRTSHPALRTFFALVHWLTAKHNLELLNFSTFEHAVQSTLLAYLLI